MVLFGPQMSSSHLYLQVEATFGRAIDENIKEDNVILEVNSLRYALLFRST